MASFSTKQRNSASKDAGFTLIELMVSMTIFTVLVTVGIGAVLNAINQHNITSNVRSIADNLNFVMEDMSRNIRTGSEYRCVTDSSEAYPSYIVSGTTSTTSDIIPQSCTGGSNKLVFKSVSGTNITYYIAPDSYAAHPDSVIKLSGDPSTSNPPQVVTPSEVYIDPTKSGFTVRGASSSADHLQPVVTIRLAGTITYKSIVTPFAIETSVAARQLDS